MNSFSIPLAGIAKIALPVFLFSALATAQQGLDAETQAKILKGYQAAPVPLNLTGRDATLVGLGSYIVNYVGECNGCHSAGPATEYVVGGNPFLGQKTKVNPVTYLGGTRDFGAFPDPAGPFPHIVSRNLTPDKTGRAAGGLKLDEFVTLMRTGVDLDKLHPTCKGAPDTKCIPPPFSGELLQIMPWPAYGNMTDRDLQSIYEYLSAIPCIEGGPGEPANRCVLGPKTTAVAGPKNTTAFSKWLQLDGSQSTTTGGGALTYQWSIPAGSPTAGISGANSAKPNVQLGGGGGIYTFLLTVTDSSGNTSMDSTTINYQGN